MIPLRTDALGAGRIWCVHAKEQEEICFFGHIKAIEPRVKAKALSSYPLRRRLCVRARCLDLKGNNARTPINSFLNDRKVYTLLLARGGDQDREALTFWQQPLKPIREDELWPLKREDRIHLGT